jgi:hypothetical protein
MTEVPDLLADLGALETAAEQRWDASVRAFISKGAGTGRGIAANLAAHRK